MRFDHQKLYEITKVITRNLNKIIDLNYYPVPEAEKSNKRHRPIGIGVQGLADAFCMMRMPFDSDEARQLNKDIFETIYYGAMESSMELAKLHGPYETWEGSPISQGIFQFDMWGVKPDSQSLGLGEVEKRSYSTWCTKFIVACSNADSFYEPDFG